MHIYFLPQPGGMKAGTFDPYPSHSADPFNIKNNRPVHVVNKSGKIFMPSAGPKSAPVLSTVNHNVNKYVLIWGAMYRKIVQIHPL